MVHHFNYEASAAMRVKYIPVERVLQVANIQKEDVVMDVGGGDGFYSIVFSGVCRKVYYVDPSERAIEIVKAKLTDSNKNVSLHRDNICTMEIPGDVTKIFFSNSFHDIECRDELLERVSESGRQIEFVLVEFHKDADIGPPPFIKIGQDELDSLFSRHGFTAAHRETLEKHYVTRYVRV